jgi:hypothetical protein
VRADAGTLVVGVAVVAGGRPDAAVMGVEAML